MSGAVVSRIDLGRHVGRVDVLGDGASDVAEGARAHRFRQTRAEMHFEVGRARRIPLRRAERGCLVDVARRVHTTPRPCTQAAARGGEGAHGGGAGARRRREKLLATRQRHFKLGETLHRLQNFILLLLLLGLQINAILAKISIRKYFLKGGFSVSARYSTEAKICLKINKFEYIFLKIHDLKSPFEVHPVGRGSRRPCQGGAPSSRWCR